MSNKTKQLPKSLQILAWIIFIGVCGDAAGIVINTIYANFIDPKFSAKFWNHTDLAAVYNYNTLSFVGITTLMSIVNILKAVLFYFIVKMFQDKKLKVSDPFAEITKKYITYFAFLSLSIALFSKFAAELCKWLNNQKIDVPSIEDLKIGGADVWFLLFFVLIVISKIFKRGIELQSENDLIV
jgi:hypothetical protein